MTGSAPCSIQQSTLFLALMIGKLGVPSSFPYAKPRNRTVRIYNASTGAASGEAWSTGQTDYIRAIAISPDNKILAAGSDDCSIMLYDMDTRKVIHKLIKGHNGVSTSDDLRTAFALK